MLEPTSPMFSPFSRSRFFHIFFSVSAVWWTFPSALPKELVVEIAYLALLCHASRWEEHTFPPYLGKIPFWLYNKFQMGWVETTNYYYTRVHFQATHPCSIIFCFRLTTSDLPKHPWRAGSWIDDVLVGLIFWHFFAPSFFYTANFKNNFLATIKLVANVWMNKDDDDDDVFFR